MIADPLAQQLAALPPDQLAYLRWQMSWTATARPQQMPPDPEEQEKWLLANGLGTKVLCADPTIPWTDMGYQAGRGYGKTRVGAEWLGRTAFDCTNGYPYAVVAPTQNDVRFTCFEGKSGLLNIIPPECVARYSGQDLFITLTNGATIRGFSAEKAERLRGPEHAAAWGDEIAAWGKDAEYTLEMLKYGMRIGDHPRFLWTSTPKPTALVRQLTSPEPGRIIVRGATFDNAANLASTFIDDIRKGEGTKIYRQEALGEMIDPEEAGIIKRSWFRLWPANKPLPRFDWIIMSLDTAYTEHAIDKKGDPDPSACSVWGVFHHEKRANAMLLDCWEEHLGLPDLIRKVRREMNTAYGEDADQALIKPMFGSDKPSTSGRKPDILLIEDKGSGISLRQSLYEHGIEAFAYNPGRADKVSRLHVVSPVFAQKRIWMPESRKLPGKPMTWCEPLIAQLCAFSGEGSIKHDDHVDACTQAIRLMLDKGMIDLVTRKVDNTPAIVHKRENPYAA